MNKLTRAGRLRTAAVLVVVVVLIVVSLSVLFFGEPVPVLTGDERFFP